MKRIFAGTAAALLIAVLLLPCRAKGISAKSAILQDAQTGRVLYEKNADSRSLIASTTKIMTALVVCEQCNVLDRMRIPKEAVGIEGSSMYLREGEVLTIQELLYGLMLQSGNDAAVALAIYCGGTVEGFVGLMNDKARALGLENTHFENPNGLDAPEHYSSAKDLATLASYAMKNPLFAKTVSTRTVVAGNRALRNHNKLLWSVDGADGVKTGFTKAAGRILVSSALRNGRRMVAVTIHAPNDWQDHTMLLEMGFSDFHEKKIVSAGDCLGQVAVVGGTGETVSVIAEEDFSYPLAEGESPCIVVPAPGFVYAPVSHGQDAGVVYLCLGNSVIGQIPVSYGETIEQEPVKKHRFWDVLFGEKSNG